MSITILRTFALNFSKNYEWFEKPISKTRKSVSSGIQTPPSRSKKTQLCLIFSTHFSGFGYPDETLFLVFDILLENCFKTDIILLCVITGLPLDMKEEEFIEMMSKYGIIMQDPDTSK